jgi:hypothetical protein
MAAVTGPDVFTAKLSRGQGDQIFAIGRLFSFGRIYENFWLLFSSEKVMPEKMSLASLWAIFLQTHLVTLLVS